MPKAGPDLYWDSDGRPFGKHLEASPWNGQPAATCKATKWKAEAVDHVALVMATRDALMVEHFFGDVLLTISGCMRGMFIAAPGCDLIASDYTAIEAVVAAAISGEQWRIDAFERGDDIYLVSISVSKNVPMQTYLDYAAETGTHHPDRADGKIQELALGYGGWINALRAFGAEGDDDTLKRQVIAWRNASPSLVEMWGGQGRGFPGSSRYVPELYGMEGAFVAAIQNPGQVYDVRGFKFYSRGDAVMLRLLSGRELTYHQPRLYPSARRAGEWAISYMTWNSNPKMGPLGWVRMDTYGPKIFENAVQATAHDIQRHGITNLTRAGYPIVLHVYDEDVAEVPEGVGSVEQFEQIMAAMPDYAATWPIRAAGGYRAKRYRKG
jgi:DNA polymerase